MPPVAIAPPADPVSTSGKLTLRIQPDRHRLLAVRVAATDRAAFVVYVRAPSRDWTRAPWWHDATMPRKVRELISDLERAGFINRGGRGSHRVFRKRSTAVTLSGNPGQDAKPYQERDVARAISQEP